MPAPGHCCTSHTEKWCFHPSKLRSGSPGQFSSGLSMCSLLQYTVNHNNNNNNNNYIFTTNRIILLYPELWLLLYLSVCVQLPGRLQLCGDVPQGDHHSSWHALYSFEVVIIQLSRHALHLLLCLFQLRFQLPTTLTRPAGHKFWTCAHP